MKIRLAVLAIYVAASAPPGHVGAEDSPALGGVGDYVIEHWEREFGELEGQIKKTSELYRRGEDPYRDMRILDSNFCIHPLDHTPLDVEYRRTMALTNLLEKEYGVGTFGKLRAGVLRLGDKTRAAGSVSRRRATNDYFEMAAIRREVALSNPLLTFDLTASACRATKKRVKALRKWAITT